MQSITMPSRASNGIVLHKKALALFVITAVVCLYLVYSWATAKWNWNSSGTQLKRLNTWKTYDFVDIPPAIISSAKEMQISEIELQLTVSSKVMSIFYRAVSPKEKFKKPAVLFLHGAGSSSEVWQQIGTMQLVAAVGHQAIAVDLPGWAKSKGADLKKVDSGLFLESFIKELKLDRPVIVSASMSGMFALPYMMNPDPATCQERVRAFVPLAPIFTEKYTHAQYHRCEIPTMIVYGTKDKDLGLTSVGNLRNMPNSEIESMQGAGHAGYQERPDEWHKLLYNFLIAVDRAAILNN